MGRVAFMVLGKSAIESEPPERALYNPAAGQDFEYARFISFDNGNGKRKRIFHE